MARDRVYINKGFRPFAEDMQQHSILGLNLIETKDIFLLAVALGVGDPAQSVSAKDGYFRTQYLKNSDKAILASVLLGTAQTDEEIDQFANLDKSLDLCERCAEAGFEVLRKKVNDAKSDNDLLERRLLNELDVLYKAKVEGLP